MNQSRKIVFFIPSFSSIEATAPLGLLAISTPLLQAGYDVRIIDSTIAPGYKRRVLEEVKDALCLGISLVTGPMIRETVEICRAVKKWNGDFPVILGGWHPSLLPGQTLDAPYVDIVVRAQGEESMVEIARRLETGASLDDVNGIGFKRGGKLHFTPERALKGLDELPSKAYQLADFDAYERVCGRRWAMYVSSLACPFNCAYCTNAGVYGRKWNALPVDHVVGETVDLTRRYRLELLWMADDNFLVDIDRALEIAEGLIRAGAAFKWSIQATTNLTARLSVEELTLLRRSGLHQICQGIETASPTVMKLMNKGFQNLDDIYQSTARCLRARVIPSFNIIFGFPGEGVKERRETVNFMMDVCRRFPGAEFWTNIFTPYPGSPIFHRAKEIGIEVPGSLEGWVDYFPRYTVLPWLKGREHQRVQTMRDYLRLAFNRAPIAVNQHGWPARAVRSLTTFPARWRLDHDFYDLPVELWMNRKLKNIVTLPKPQVDAKLLEAGFSAGLPMNNKVVLFYPSYGGPPLGAPLCLLSLAPPLLNAGFRVSLIDGAITPDAEEAVAREAAGALCLGVSLLTGPMIRTTARICRQVKRSHPDLPIILGGWHPSLMPAQTLQAEFVDAVVRGQGELTLLEIAQRLAEGQGFRGIRGVSHKQGGRMVHEPERPVENINNLPPPAYDLADFDAYARVRGRREMGYATSVGCPYACNYCTDQVFYKRRFNAYRAERVVSEVLGLVERYRLDEVAFLDSNFLVDVKRALAIARGFTGHRTKFRWTVQTSTDLLCRMSDDEVCLLAESGLRHMGFGTESASQEVLALMNKKHQRVSDMFETARKTEKAGIRVTFNVILGYPGETGRDRLETFRIMSDVARRHSNISFSPNVFTPYPGIPIWPQLREMGVREPESLEEWNDLPLGQNILPWLQGEELRRMRRMLEFFLLNNQIRKAVVGHPVLSRGFRRALGAPLRWRLRGGRFGFPWELWVARTTERLVTRRSLLTGQPLAHSIQEVC